MSTTDWMSILLVLIVLASIGYTIYLYVSNHYLSHYALGVSVVGILIILSIYFGVFSQKSVSYTYTHTGLDFFSPIDYRNNKNYGGGRKRK